MPFIFFYDSNPQYALVLLKIKSQDIRLMRQTIHSIQNIWERFYPTTPFTWQFLDDRINAKYAKEVRNQNIFVSFSMVTIIIACMGLLGLVSFTTKQRTKEIGIRKVLGASVSGIVVLLSKEFTKWVLLANILAWPVAYYAMKNWLQNFAYRIELSWEFFILTGWVALMIAILIVGFLAIKAAIANPVETLRYE